MTKEETTLYVPKLEEFCIGFQYYERFPNKKYPGAFTYDLHTVESYEAIKYILEIYEKGLEGQQFRVSNLPMKILQN